ncbi:hypothetical protein JNUCC0626_26795 [Lentzea sp. JNUCC 0626]|uniref:hypothetical protein n=1 Tax=Lentzea sp. JNUCC 0626 TaxID=3367513 RepID=UPI0037491AEB
MNIRLLTCALLAVTTTACGTIAVGPPDPELPEIIAPAQITLKPQEVANLPKGRDGLPHNAILACEVMDWPVVHALMGREFRHQEGYDDEHEARDCRSHIEDIDSGKGMVAATRTDRSDATPLYDSLKAFAEEKDILEEYTGRKPSTVRECFWLRDFLDHSLNTGMVCRDTNNVTVHFIINLGISKADTIKLMAVALARSRAYFEAYHR